MRVNKQPLVSVCIPTYNGEKFLAEALESAINQTYKNLEIIISDDASTDKTLSIAESFRIRAKIDLRIYNHKPSGIGANWNNCVRKAKGEYIKFLFQDDVLKVDCIERMLKIMLEHPRVGLVYSKREIIANDKSDFIDDFVLNYSNLHEKWGDFIIEQGVISGKIYLKDSQFLNAPKNKIGEPTNVLLRRKCFQLAGYFNENLRQTLDYEYWHRLMKYFDIGFVNEHLSQFRLHHKQASFINKQNIKWENRHLMKSYYANLFWQLNWKNKLKLLKLYHPLFKALVNIKRKFLVFN